MEKNRWIDKYFYQRSTFSSDAEAVFDYTYNTKYTYGELETRANKLANYLAEVLNIQKGDRIAFCSNNSIELIDAYYASAKIGAILTTYNHFLSESNLAEMINNEKPKVFFYEKFFQDKVNRLKKLVDISNYFVLKSGELESRDTKYEEIMNYHNDRNRSCDGLKLEDTHMIIHTGGTTGVPKGAKISYKCLLTNIRSEILNLNLKSSDCAHILIPMFHTSGWNVLTLPLLHIGGRIILTKGFDPEQTLEIISKEKTTFLFGVPTMFKVLSDSPNFDSTDFSPLKAVYSGSAPTPRYIMEKYWDKNIKFALAYGLSEAGPNSLAMDAVNMTVEELKAKFDSVGKPMNFTETKIVDENNEEVEIGTPGEILWRGPMTFSGYWNNESETNIAIRDGWVRSGDIAKIDDDGYFYIVGRKKNMFITGGENIFPNEIGSVILQHPTVRECSVIGVPDEKWGEVGKAIIVVENSSEFDLGTLKKFVKEYLSTIKTPRYFEIVDHLPKNSAGKVLRSELIRLYGNYAN